MADDEIHITVDHDKNRVTVERDKLIAKTGIVTFGNGIVIGCNNIWSVEKHSAPLRTSANDCLKPR
jgi:hypothetical protein